MVKLHNKYKTKFVLGLGDNIYPNGCVSVDDPLFQTNFEDPYSILPNDDGICVWEIMIMVIKKFQPV